MRENANLFIPRPNASEGLWLMFLLPGALLATIPKYSETVSATYKLSYLFSLSFTTLSIVAIWKQRFRYHASFMLNFAICIILTLLFRVLLHRGWGFSAFSAIFATFIYQRVKHTVSGMMPKSFTLGEGAICSQAITLLIYFTCVKTFEWSNKTPTSYMQTSTLIIQYGLIGLSANLYLLSKIKRIDPRAFWICFALGAFCLILAPMAVVLQYNPLLLIVEMFIYDLKTYKITILWVVCSVLAVIAINKQIKKGKKATTSIRKIFHILAVSVFVPGLLFNCTMLYLASGVVFGIFIFLEIMRLLQVAPLAQYLTDGLTVFSDEKDVGPIALTPFYLLAGCSLPLWLHPSPCDVTNSAMFDMLPLLSGILTTGVGDTAASFIGSKFGRFHWKQSKKTVEGTLAYILAQGMFVGILLSLGTIQLDLKDYSKLILSVVLTGVVEAKTDQVDNLILPFIMYIILVL